MAQLGQAPIPYEPKHTQIVSEGVVEYVRNSPDGIVGNDAQNDRILFGYQRNGFGDGDFGIKISREGVDVRSAQDDELIMSSAFNLPKIVTSDVVVLTPPAVPTPGTTVQTYAHNFGFVPTFLAFWEFDGNSYFPVPKYWFTAGGALAYSLEAYTTATNFNVEFTYMAASPAGYPGPINIRFYLMRETAS